MVNKFSKYVCYNFNKCALEYVRYLASVHHVYLSEDDVDNILNSLDETIFITLSYLRDVKHQKIRAKK